MQLHSALRALLIPSLTSLAAAQGLYLGPDVQDPPPPPVVRPPVVVRPEPPRPHHGPSIRTTQLQVTAEIRDGVASTRLRQIFRNDGGRIGEATWILPLPAGATADGFTMTVDGKEMPAEVLGAGRARQIYEEIVRRQRDPGLLEYLGHGCLRARVFPIPAQGEVAVEVRFRQVLPETAGLHRWTYPLRATGAGGTAPEKLTLDVRIRSSKALKNVYSPMPGVDVQRTGDHEARLSMEASGGQLPERDLSVFYGLNEQEFGLNLLTYRKGGEPGYFMMMLAPKQEWPIPAHTRKAITFVIDTSGSMQGEKIEQARKALRFFVQSLQARDLFNVVPFSTEARPFFPAPVVASGANVEVAVGKISEIQARGGTNIEDALRAALVPEAPGTEGVTTIPITVFLTDGLPTVGQTDISQILGQAKQQNATKQRIFVFGVGNDVNTALLDKLAVQSRGERDYVREHEDIEHKTGALFTKLSHPVMTGVELVCQGIDGYDMFPRLTPDLFKGSRLLAVGRYKGAGHHAIRLKGVVDGSAKEYVFEGAFPEKDTENDFLPVLWAERKVAVLLDAIRLNGQKKELVEEVTRLGKEFGIVTPFTSHLILEEGMRVSRLRGLNPQDPGDMGLWFGREQDAGGRVLYDLRRAGAVGPSTPGAVSVDRMLREGGARLTEERQRAEQKLRRLAVDHEGKAAVDDSSVLRLMSSTIAPAARGLTVGGGFGNLLSRRVKDRTFYLAGGVWVDAGFDAGSADRVRKVKAFSDDYFALLRDHPEVAPYLAFSSRIVVVLDDQVVEII